MTHHEPYAPSIVTRARELLAGITPGKWKFYPSDSYRDIYALADGEPSRLVFEHSPAPREDDAAFIAAAPDLIAGLLDEIEQLQAACRAWVAEIERLQGLQRDDQDTAKQAIAERDDALAATRRILNPPDGAR